MQKIENTIQNNQNDQNKKQFKETEKEKSNSQLQQQQNQDLKSKVTLNKDEILGYYNNTHSYSGRIAKAEEKKVRWNSGTMDINKYIPQEEKIKNITQALNQIEEDEEQTDIQDILYQSLKKARDVKSRKDVLINDYIELKNKKEIGDHARYKALKTSSSESSPSLEESYHAQTEITNQNFYQKIKNKLIEDKKSVVQQNQLKQNLPIKKVNNLIKKTDQEIYNEKVRAMKAKDLEQSLRIYSDSESGHEDQYCHIQEDKYNFDRKQNDIDEADHEDEEFNQEMQKISQDKFLSSLQSNNNSKVQNKKNIETDSSKWKDSGFDESDISHLKNEYHKKIQVEPLFQKTQNVQIKGINLKQNVENKEKKIMTLDGKILEDRKYIIEKSTEANKKFIFDNILKGSINHSIDYKSNLQKQKEQNNKIITQSKFFILKQAQTLSSHISQNPDRQQQFHQNSNIENNDHDIQQEYFTQKNGKRTQKKSQNLSQFGMNHQHQKNAAHEAIPMVKQWFEQLSVPERVQCMTTIDVNITKSIRQMHSQLTKTSNNETGKFKMHSQYSSSYSCSVIEKGKQNSELQLNLQPKWFMQQCNSQSFKSSQEIQSAELKLIKFVRLTDTFQMHDTLTVSEDLVQNTQLFYQLAQEIVGTNYLVSPHQISWLDQDYQFESFAPMWIDMQGPNSLAYWILYYFERALFIQYNYNVYDYFVNIKDQKNFPIFNVPDRKLIVFKDEMRPFWRTFCDECKQQNQFDIKFDIQEMISMCNDNDDEKSQNQFYQFVVLFINKSIKILCPQVLQDNEIKQQQNQKSNINKFNGGLSISNLQSQIQKQDKLSDCKFILEKIQRFSQKLKLYILSSDIKNPDKQSELNLQEACMNTLQECSSMIEDMDPVKLAKNYQFQHQIQKSPDTISASQQGNSDDDCTIKELQVINKKVDIYLQRVFAESFKEIVEGKLKAGCVSENKKLLKKKLKKKIAQEKQKELEREVLEKKRKEEEDLKLKKDKQKIIQVKAKEENDKIILNTKNAIDLLMQNDTKIEKNDQANPRNLQNIKNEFQELKDKKQQEANMKKKKNKKGKNIQKQEPEKKIEQIQENIKSEQIKESWNESEKVEEILKFKLIEEESKIKSNSKNENQTQKLIQSHNYFKFFDPKILDLSQKQQEQQSNDILVNHSEQDPMNLSEIKLDFNSSEANLAIKKAVLQKNNFQNSISGTIKTDCSTREQSKKTFVQEDEQQIQDFKFLASTQAMSNQEIIDVYQKSIQVKKEQNGKQMIVIQEKKRNEGNLAIKTQEHQRNQVDNKYHQDIRSIVNELVSEETGLNQINDQCQNNLIQILVKDSKMHVHKDFLETCSQNSQEKKKEKSKNKRKQSSSSDGKSEESSDQDYLPDVYQKFDPQPHDNDSSDFGADGEIESESIIEDNYSSYIDSATASNKDKKWVQKNQHRQLSSKINQNQNLQKISAANLLTEQKNEIAIEMKINSQNQKDVVSALLTQKSIKSAHLKIESKQIESQTNNKQDIADPDKNHISQQEQKNIQEAENVQQSINEQKKQKNKKTKKQKKEAFLENQKKNNEIQDQAKSPEIKQIEIIKPQVQKPVKQKLDVKKQNEQVNKKKNKVEEQKVTSQKPSIQPDKLNNDKKGEEQKQQQQNKQEAPQKAIDQTKKNTQHIEPIKINQQNNELKFASKNIQESQTKQNENQKSIQKKNDDQKQLNFYYQQDRQSKQVQKPQQTQDWQKGSENKKQIYQQKTKKSLQEEFIQKKYSQEEQKKEEAKSETEFAKFQKQSENNDLTKFINKSNQSSNQKINQSQQQTLQSSVQSKQNSKRLFESSFQEKEQTFEKVSPNIQLQKESDQSKVNNDQQISDQINSSSQSTKKKSSRKKKKNKNNIQNSWIDPNTGQTVFMDNSNSIYNPNNQFVPYNQNYQQQQALILTQQLQKLSQQMQQTGNAFVPNQGGMQGAVVNPVSGQIQQNQDLQMRSQNQFQPMSISQQVQEILFKLNERIIIQQQQQAEEIQKKQQIEQENLLQEECEPCPEINSQRYEQFFELLEDEMKNKVKQIDQLKDSVRKERQGFIQMVEQKVKETFQNKFGNGYVGIKIFGSMATELAIETSDVDLVVTGIKFTQIQNQSISQFKDPNKDNLLKIMHQLYDCLENLKQKGQIYKMKFIQGANVPIIKLVADLQVVSQIQAEKQIAEVKKQLEEEHGEKIEQQIYDKKIQQLKANIIDHKMRYLKIDISIDEQSDNPQPKYEQMGKSFSQAQQFSRSHSGIETIYHIQELVKKRKDLRPIVMIIKKIFDETYLSMPYYGGISSYSLVLMVSAFLNRYDEDKDQSLSRNLSGFFHFYGAGFKPNLYYLKGDSIEFCEDQSQRPSSDPFIVLDPLDLSNNISHSTFRFKDIQRALVQAFKIINESCKKFQLPSTQNEHKNKKRNEDIEIYHPKKVINRLLEEIKEEYRQYTSTYDDI